MNRYRNLIGIIALALLVLSLPVITSAQWRGDRDDDDYRNDRRGSYNRNLRSTIKNLKNRSNQFERRIDRELDDSRYDSRNREDRINQIARDFAHAADDLEDVYDGKDDYRNSYDEAQQVLRLGNQLDRALRRARLSDNVQNEWYRISQDLNVLANAYNSNYNNRNNRNNRRNRQGNYGDWRDRIPFPLPFYTLEK